MSNVKVLKVSAIIFAVLAICGGIYVILTGGKASPGFAVVAMVFSLALSSMARRSKK